MDADVEVLRIELQKYIDSFRATWISRLKDEYGGDINRLYRENSHELFNDVMPIWELSTRIYSRENFNGRIFTEEEQALRKKVLKENSIDTGVNIFDL